MWAKITEYILNQLFLKVLELLGKYIPTWLDDIKKQLEEKKREKTQDLARKEYEAVASNPVSTAEERAKSYEDAINSGR
ncbi:MAG: hypothetical protein IM559_23900 [Pseudanabaena sp. M151S2SP2A07QC]|jgi:hypothetical protein|nr:hypothetical protein [Pseudanabaena sp. M151S2SP2A07QC]